MDKTSTDPRPSQATLTSNDLRSSQIYHANPPKGAIFHDVLPGRYRLETSCFGGYVALITSGTIDLLANPTLRIQGGVAPGPIEISLKNGGGSLALTIILDHPPLQIWTLLVPQFAASAGPQVQPAFQAGEFQAHFMNLAPGDYTVYAFSTDEIEFRNPQFLQSLSAGVSVTVEEGANKQVTITSLVR